MQSNLNQSKKLKDKYHWTSRFRENVNQNNKKKEAIIVHDMQILPDKHVH